jgi:hypothetical protein
MMNFVRTKLLALLLIAGCVSVEISRPIEDVAWEYACTYQECGDLHPPTVVQSDHLFSLWELQRAYGVYLWDENYVYIRNTFQDPDQKIITLTHEMVHYITRSRGEFPASCDNENNAFRVGDIVARRIGREDLVRGTTWWRPYANCQGYTRGE